MAGKPTLRYVGGAFWLVGKMQWNATIKDLPFGPAPGSIVDHLMGPFASVDEFLLHRAALRAAR